MKNKVDNQSGFIVGTLLVLIFIVSVLLVTVTQTAINNFQLSTKQNARLNAQFSADGGLDQAIHEINLDENWPGTEDGFGNPVEIELFNDAANNYRTTYQVEIDSPDSDTKIIKSTGRTYRPASSTEAFATRIFELELRAVTSGTGPGSVVSGVGGLTLNNNAKITGGDVIVNGSVQVNNNAQIGLSTNPVNLRVAHQSCPSPVNATYPQVCTSGEPINNSGNIYADVQAQNQTTTTGMSLPGLTSSTFPPVAVPGYDRGSPTGHKSRVAISLPPNDSQIRCNNNQTKTWPANVRITGDVRLGNNCEVTLLGEVWIEGNITFGNNAEIIIDDTVGTDRPVIMVDGEDGLDTGNNTVITPNSFGTGAEVITVWWNTDTGTNGGFDCGGIADPLDCTSVTGLALSTSQSQTTIDLSNNTDASNTVFRTLWSRAFIANNGSLGAVAGQTIQLGNNAVINFTASISGSDNLVKTWVKRGYLRVFQ